MHLSYTCLCNCQWIRAHKTIQHFKEPLKMHKKVTKNTHLTLSFRTPLRAHLKICPMVYFKASMTPLRAHLKICPMVYFKVSTKKHKKNIWGWNKGCTWCNYRVTLLDVHGGAPVSAQECQKQLSKKLNLRGDSMLHFNAHLRFYFRKHLKCTKIWKRSSIWCCT